MKTIAEKLASIHAGYGLQPEAKKAETAAEEATLYIYDAITPDGWGGVSAKSVVAALTAAKDAKTLHIRINSPGGSAFEAMAICQQLRECKARKVVHVDGLAASAASFIAMMGDEIITTSAAMWFIHGAQGMTMGSAADHRETADLLDKVSDSIADIYAKRTGRTVSEVRAWMDADTFMTAKEAKARGFADSIDGDDEKEEPTASTPAVRKIVALSQDLALRFAAAVVEARRDSREAASGSTTPGQPGNKQ